MMMSKSNNSNDRIADLLEQVLEATQNLFIFEALQAGATGVAIRELLHVNQWRVTNVSKVLKTKKQLISKG